MAKILYLITQSEWGGAQRYVFDLATRLRQGFGGQANWEIYVAAGGNGELFSRLEGQKLPSTQLKYLVRAINPYFDLMAYFELKKLLGHIKPDIVHLNSSKAGFIGSLAAKKAGIKKIVYTAHGFVFNEPLPFWKKWLYKKIELFSSRRIDKIICVSEYDRQTGIAAGIDQNKLITIHNGIDVGTMNFLSREEARLSLRGAAATKQSYQRNGQHTKINDTPRDVRIASVASTLPRNDKWIGCIANFYPTKGLDVLIQAMKNIDATLVLIGDGPENKNLRLRTYDLGLKDKIFFAGSIPNASQYLKAFDLFVLPSRKEGLPYTVLEAALAGIPVVATKVGGVPEIIKDNATGYLAAPDDSNDLEKKINLGLARPLAPKGSGFDLEAMAQKTEVVYNLPPLVIPAAFSPRENGEGIQG